MKRLIVLCLFLATAAQAADIDEQIAATRAEIAAVRAAIEPRVSAIEVRDADVRVWVSKSVFTTVASAFNGLTPAQRTLKFQATGGRMPLKNSNGGALGCGWYVELNGNRANADFALSNLAAQWVPIGGVDTSIDFDFRFAASLHAHVKGPAGPCWSWPPRISCDCPVGGGFGTVVGVTGQKGGTGAASLRLGADAVNWLTYTARLTQPGEVNITLSFSLQHVGNVGVPVKFNVPSAPLVSGAAPPLFDRKGEIRFGSTTREYTFTLKPSQFRPDETGAAVKGVIELVWQ